VRLERHIERLPETIAALETNRRILTHLAELDPDFRGSELRADIRKLEKRRALDAAVTLAVVRARPALVPSLLKAAASAICAVLPG